MHHIDMQEPSAEFRRCWQAAGRHVQGRVQGPLHSWLKANLHPPFLEHLSFRLGNQLFFVRIEDVTQRLTVPGSRSGLLYIAEGCKGHPCIMPMRQDVDAWIPTIAGWGLLDARTSSPIDPIALVTDDRIEMSDWELQDFAVQMVRNHLEGEGRKLMSWHGNPSVDPSLWFIGDDGPEWVVVRAVRYPVRHAARPAGWNTIAQECASLGKKGHFASVGVASADEAFETKGVTPPVPLWRGHGMVVRFEGLDPA